MHIGIFDNKQKMKKVNKKENVHETKKELSFYYNTTITIEDVKVLHYLGMFGDCYAALIKGDCMAIPESEIQIGGILFVYDREVISIYNDGKYYYLKEAYDLKLITKQQLLDIYIEYQEYIHK